MVQDENGNSRYEYFPETRTISGTYEKLVSGIVEMGVSTDVTFIPDDSERKKLPVLYDSAVLKRVIKKEAPKKNCFE